MKYYTKKFPSIFYYWRANRIPNCITSSSSRSGSQTAKYHEPQRAATAEDYISDIDLIPMVLTVNLYVPIFFALARGKLRTVHSEHVCVCVRVGTHSIFHFFFSTFSITNEVNAHVSFILHLQILRRSDKKIVLAQSSLKC